MSAFLTNRRNHWSMASPLHSRSLRGASRPQTFAPRRNLPSMHCITLFLQNRPTSTPIILLMLEWIIIHGIPHTKIKVYDCHCVYIQGGINWSMPSSPSGGTNASMSSIGSLPCNAACGSSTRSSIAIYGRSFTYCRCLIATPTYIQETTECSICQW
jgi:hypothetical protein